MSRSPPRSFRTRQGLEMNLAVSRSVFAVGRRVLPVNGGTIYSARCSGEDLNLSQD